MSSPILITGIPRSGTSLTAGLVSLGGIFGGKTVPGNPNNEKGFYENAEVRNRIIKPYLIKLGRDPMGQKPLPDPEIKMEIPGLRKKMESIIGATKGERWFYKEPKLLLAIHPFVTAFPDAKWVIVRRDSNEILNSVHKTNFMRAYKDREGWRPWLRYHLQRIEELKNSSQHFSFWPSRALDGDFAHIAQMSEFLGIRIPWRPAIEFLEPSLWASGSPQRSRKGFGGSG